MKKYSLKTDHKKIIADTITPVSVYLKVRDRYPNSILLESSDYHGNDNSFSYICFNPIASIKIQNEIITQTFPDGSIEKTQIDDTIDVPHEIHLFSKRFEVEKDQDFKFINNGIFGYTAYDAVRYFEDIEISKKDNSLINIYSSCTFNFLRLSSSIVLKFSLVTGIKAPLASKSIKEGVELASTSNFISNASDNLAGT